MLGADVGVIESFGFLGSESEDFLDPRSVRDIADHLLIGTGADLFFDFHADGLEIEAELLEDVDSDALAELDEAEEQMFGADEIVVKTVGFLPREGKHLLRARGEVIHGFGAHTSKCNYFSCLSNPVLC